MNKYEAMSLLPKVGDVRIERPVVSDKNYRPDPAECVVVEVHPTELWYRVRFTDTGFCECYKVPTLKPIPTGGVPW